MRSSDLLAHLRRTRFALGDKEAALSDARSIAEFLKSAYGAGEVVGVGSLFESPRPFRKNSDIDLVVTGVAPERFIEACDEAAKLSAFEVNLIPRETANALMADIVRTRGVKL